MRKINSFVALIIVSNILFLSGCQTSQIKTATPEVLAEFDIEGGIRHIILPVTFQGKEYPFVLDTAGMRTAFDDSFKDKLGKRFLWPNKGRGPEGKKFKVEYYRGHDYYLGPLDMEDTSLLRVIDLDKLVPGKNRKFQGIIGLDFLKKYIVQIDFDEGQVRFFKGKKDFDLFSMFKPKENKHPEWGEPIPMKARFLTGLSYIEGYLTGIGKVNFLVDTGWLSPNSLKTSIFEKIYSQDVSVNIQEAESKTSISGYEKINVIENFTVGPFEYKNEVFRRSNESVLGLTYLYRHIVTIDFPNNVLYLQKGKNFDKQLIIQVAIGETGCFINAASHEVIKVNKNTPAYEKGIREKDILIKINDYDLTLLDIAELMELPSRISKSENEEGTLTFKRSEETYTVSFKKSEK